MYQLTTPKQLLYFNEVIRLHYEEGLGNRRIAKIIPIAYSTVTAWINIFAKEKGKITIDKDMRKSQTITSSLEVSEREKLLQERVKELEIELKKAEIKAEAYDRMIDIAEAKFRIPIRKKAGAKQ